MYEGTNWANVVLLIWVVVGVLGASGMVINAAGEESDIGQVAVGVWIALLVVMLVLGFGFVVNPGIMF